MNTFNVNFQFNDYKHLLELKRQYEVTTKNILVTTNSHKLKGSSDFVTSTVYDRITYQCKAGKERPSKSKGIRSSSTFKKDCPFKVRIGLVNNKLTVMESNNCHANHRSDEITFQHYPENLRLNENEIVEARKIIACDGNKQRLKMTLMKNRSTPVPLRSLHNLQTKMRQKIQQLGQGDELEKLLENMKSIANSIVEVITNEDGELIGIYFQDERMRHMYGQYPHVLFFDATHNLNSRKMPLFIQSVVDGNGETEIASLFICKSESRESIGAMIDIFQKHNTPWSQTKVIIGDKDFADRSVYSEKFRNAVLQICLFHVCRTFNREITQCKRDITKDQRIQALEIIQKIIYSRTEEGYDLYHNQLVQLKLPKVNSYFNDNWHAIKDEWTLHGCNKFANYMNLTNNRLESLNGKLKMLGNRYANLLSCFENLSISVSVVTSERDIKVIRRDMKVPRIRFTDETLERYNGFVTPFIFTKIEEQYDLSKAVKFSSIDQEKAIVESQGRYSVSNDKCSCLFFSSMILPCRHIFKFLSINNCDLFVPNVCADRWTKSYYNRSHPVLNSDVNITATKPVYVNVIKVPEEKDRYKKTAKVTKEINNISASLATEKYAFFLKKIESLRNEMVSEPAPQHDDTPVPQVNGDSNDVLAIMQRQFTNFLNSAAQIVSPDRPTSIITQNIENSQSDALIITSPTTEVLPQLNLSNRIPAIITSNSMENTESNVLMTTQKTTCIESTSTQNTEPSVTSSLFENIRRIKLPSKIVSVGRPKGSKTTVIGTKRKPSNLRNAVPAKKPFLERLDDDQAITILQWLTKMTPSDIIKKKISDLDIVADPTIWDRLRNSDIISIYSLRKFVSLKCFTFILSEIEKRNQIDWNCKICKNILEGDQVMCSCCLDWFHFDCVKFSKTKEDFFCQKC